MALRRPLGGDGRQHRQRGGDGGRPHGLHRGARQHGRAARGRSLSGAGVADSARRRRTARAGGTTGSEPDRGAGGLTQRPADRRRAGAIRTGRGRGRDRPTSDRVGCARDCSRDLDAGWGSREAFAHGLGGWGGESHGDHRRSRAGRCQHPAGSGQRSRGSGRLSAAAPGGGPGDRLERCCAGGRSGDLVGGGWRKHRLHRIPYRFAGRSPGPLDPRAQVGTPAGVCTGRQSRARCPGSW